MEIVMPHSGEFVDLEQALDTDLIACREELKAYIDEAKLALSLVETHFIGRMQEREATKYTDEAFKVTVEQKMKYEYDLPRLLQLREHLSEQDFNGAVKIEYKPNKTALNKLVKFGGDVKQIIEESINEIPQAPSLKVERLITEVSA